MIIEPVAEDNKVVLTFDGDKAGRSGSEDALNRLVSQVYVKLIKLGEEGPQPDTLSKQKIKKLLG